jgi:putative ABC transport system substrate-binding protein
MMRRRDLLIAAGAAAVAWPLAASAQQPRDRVARVAVLMGVSKNAQGEGWYRAFRKTFEQLGWKDGGNVAIDLRWGAGDINRIRAQAAELVQSKPDVIMCSSVRVVRALRKETNEIPIVFVATADPVAQGIVASFARPGGNLTGFTLYEFSVAGKLVELAKEIVPDVTRVAVLFNPENTSAKGYLQVLESIAPKLGVELVPVQVRDVATIEAGIVRFAREPNGALLLPPDVTTRVYREPAIALAARHKIVAIYSDRADVMAGGLIAYGPDLRGQFRGAASYVDRILKGEKPADLPVQAPTEYEFLVNMKTARVLGLTFPQSILARAEVIE